MLCCWTVTDYRTVLMALKTRSDGALPSRLDDLSKQYDEWEHRITGEIMMDQTQVEVINEGVQETGVDVCTHENYDGNCNDGCLGTGIESDLENSEYSDGDSDDSVLRSQILL